MPTYVYGHEEAGEYPYPPLAAKFQAGDELDLAEDQVPRDGRWWLKGPDGQRLPLPPYPAPEPPAEPAAADAEPPTPPAESEPSPEPTPAPAAAKTAPKPPKEA